jgi:putative transposase
VELNRERLSPHAPQWPAGQSPLARYQQDLARIRTLGERATRLDELFHHRVQRKVRNDGTVSYCGARFEVPYVLSGRRVRLVVDPYSGQALGVEDDDGLSLGAVTPLDALANVQHRRRQPQLSCAAVFGTGVSL